MKLIMLIVNEYIELRAIEKNDRDILLELINDPEIEYELGGSSYPISTFQQEKWIEGLTSREDILRTMIVDKKNNTVVGTAILTDIDFKNGSAEIHIKIAKNHQGKQYGSKVIRLLCCYSFDELRLNCIYANIISYNKASQKLFEKCGFIQEGRMRDRVFKKGNYYDVLSYSLLLRDANS
ncbi:GNAT family N-acetyltransferase [Vagococcus fluvialis]|uniref:GNAT family N-acetyltransferase n=1 Tax=Vagococcus fluvialis TaxID=2738 RepID=UPI001D09D139|nr:GNAT family protein [Vagococcus fluvialis]UDM73883.1 GNAT family N-acetyltransferase [Vagococcus fluvialis]